MKRILTLLALIVLVAACTQTAPTQPAPVEPTQTVQETPAEDYDVTEIVTEEQHNIDIKDSRFMPTILTISTGDSVTWTNADDVPHTATSADFDTEKLVKGQSKTVTFDTSGTYTYMCSFHPNMKGTIIVE